jgi:hypothetical protein
MQDLARKGKANRGWPYAKEDSHNNLEHGPDGEGSPIRLFVGARVTGSLFPWFIRSLPWTRSAVRADANSLARHAPNLVLSPINQMVTINA